MPVDEVSCPNCGAPVEIPDERATILKCPYCRTTIQRKLSSNHVVVVENRKPAAASKPVSGVVWVFLVIFFLGSCIAPFLFFGAMESSVQRLLGNTGITNITIENPGIFEPEPAVEIYNYSIIHLEPQSETEGPAIVFASSQQGGGFLSYLDLNAEAPLRWSSLTGESSVNINAIVAMDDQRVYLADEARLSARSRQTGDVLWQAPLSDNLPYDCATCLAALEDALVVLTFDGVLTGYNPQTGEMRWQVKLEETPRSMAISGGFAVVKDQLDPPQVLYRRFDPATGQEAEALVPACPNDTFSDSPQWPDLYSPILATRQHVFALAGWYEPACYQKWNTALGTQVVQVTFPEDQYPSPTFSRYILDDGYLVAGESEGALVFNTDEDRYIFIPAEEDIDLEALAVSGGSNHILLFKSTERRGTAQVSAAAYNLSGERLWSVLPTAKNELSENSRIVSSEAWFFMVGDEDLLLFEGADDPIRLTVEKFNLQTGVSQGAIPVALGEERSIIFYLYPIGVTGDTAWIMANQQIMGINLTDLTVRFSWP